MPSPLANFALRNDWLPLPGQRLRNRNAIKVLLTVVLAFGIFLDVCKDNKIVAQNYPQTGAGSSLLLRPFQWSNDTSSQNQSEKRAEVATDENSSATTDFQPPGKSLRFNPFSWTNDPQTEAEFHSQNTNQSTIADRLKRNLSIVQARKGLPNPLKLTNEITPTTDARSFQPPPHQSFSEAIQSSFSWQQDPDAEPDPELQKSMPPPNATDKQLVEWEKEKFPWIRPFYWSEPEFGTPEAEALEPIADITPSHTEGKLMPLLARPFQWTNRPNVATATAQSATASDARTVAFLQNGEALPLPPQLNNQAESLPAGQGTEDSLKIGEDEKDDKGAIGEAETLGREPVDNSLQFLRADTVLLKPGQCQWDYGLAYTLFDRTLPVVIQTAPDTATIELARFRRRELIVPLEVRYGFTRRIQLFVNAPLGWSNTEFAFTSIDEFDNSGGIGDVVFGGTFLLRQGDHEISDAILTFACTAPTGQDPFAPVVGLTPSAPALGGGTWNLASNLLFVKNYDPVVVFYGFGTRQHFLREVEGRNFRAGGEYLYQMGVGFAVNEKITFSTRFNGAYITESKLDGEKIEGSIQEPMTVGLAMTVSKCKRLIEPFVDFGLTNDATDARFGIVWTR